MNSRVITPLSLEKQVASLPDQTQDQTTYVESSGLFRRLAALVYDGFLLAALWFITTGILVVINGGDALSPLLSQFVLLPTLITITVIFYTWFWTHGGQTLGMKTWKIRLVTSSGTGILTKHALLRILSSILSITCMGAGFIWVLIDSKKCTWHDHLSQTRVVKLD